MKKIEIKATNRGFAIGEFEDFNGVKCSIQKSSIATDDCIWLGCKDANPKILAFHINGGFPNGWVDYPVHPEALFNTRMHLSRKQVKKLLPLLQKFVETGDI